MNSISMPYERSLDLTYPLKIMVVEDQRLVREAISALLSLEDDFEVISQCEDGKQALTTLQASANNLPDCITMPDIILSDIEMPNMTGIELAERVKTHAFITKVVMMTTFSRPGYIKRALNADAKGFILKEAPSEYLVNSLRKVAGGRRVIEPELAIMALSDEDPLSDKERKALALTLNGFGTKDIASALFLSEGTVRNYLSEAIAKLDATNRVDAGRIAKQKGWL
jgi:two-component system response regulator DesR